MPRLISVRALRVSGPTAAMAAAVGALAVGAVALGAVAIGRLAVGRAVIRRLEVEELEIAGRRVTPELLDALAKVALEPPR